MKSQLVLIIFVTSIATSFVNIEGEIIVNTTAPIDIEEVDCGPSSLSASVKGAFRDKSSNKYYLNSELYKFKDWILLINNSKCHLPLEQVFDLSGVERFNKIEIIEGAWRVSFQTGVVGYSTLDGLREKGIVWNFYPETVSHNVLRYEPNDEFYVSGDQWYLDNYGQNGGTSGIDINPQNVWEDYAGDGIIIGVIDNGIDYNNPDLSSNFLGSYSYDYCDNDGDVMPSDSDGDGEIDWHGTAVSGIVSAEGNNTEGIVGVSYNSSIIGIRLISDDCSANLGTDELEHYALNHRLDLVDIYTNSWGPEDDGKTLRAIGPLALAALEKGVNEGRDGLGSVYVWAAGNGLKNLDNSNKDAYANSRYTIAVGSTNWKGELTDYSEFGSNVMVVAPSHNNDSWTDPAIFTTDILGTDGHNSTDYLNDMGGTSASAPMVAGVVSLMLEANSNLTWRDVQHILIRTSKKIDHMNEGWITTYVGRDYNHAYGYGLVDATAAVNLAMSWENVEEEISFNVGEVEVNDVISDGYDIGITSEVFVNESIDIETVEIKINIQHKYRGDLNLFLTSPSNITSELVMESLDDGEDYYNWTFSSVVHWDENSFGNWRLKVNDTEDSYQGTWENWNMTFYGRPALDTDGDNLTDFAETRIGTGFNNPDYDNDNLLDGEEYYGWYDLDGGFHVTDPNSQDSDNDGVTDWYEGRENNQTASVTNPNDNDTDDDGLLDGCEIYGFDNAMCLNVNNYITNATNSDTDNDTISDFDEIYGINSFNRTSNPTKPDTDDDGMPDWYELDNGFRPRAQIDGSEDRDCDGILVEIWNQVCTELGPDSMKYTNYMEYLMGTNPDLADTDGDGVPDGWEYFMGLDPLTRDSDLDSDNDTISNMYEYNNFLIESSIFSLENPELIAYWKFDSFDPIFALDITDNSHFGRILGDSSRLPAKFGNGIYCDGDDDYIRLDSMTTTFTEYTVHTWVKLTNYTEFGTIFGTVNDGRTWLGIDSEGYIQFRVYSGDTIYTTPLKNDSVAKLNVWYHVAATYSETEGSLRLYVNGTLVSNESISPSDSIKAATSYNYMCRGENGEYLNGTIDNIALWSRAFTDDEMRYFYEQPLGLGNYANIRVDDGIRFTNPNSIDTDGDGLSDNEEFYYGIDGFLTDPTKIDTDDDSLSDYYEVMVFGTNPTTNDTDGDNITDDVDFFPLDPTEWVDTDGDGYGDNLDDFPFDKNESFDSDFDSLGDNYELLSNPQTDNTKPDTDDDGYCDGPVNVTIDDIQVCIGNDIFPTIGSEWSDKDGDGVGDNSDACPDDNRDWKDTDLDTFCDNSDAFPENPSEWKDTDSDGYGDMSDKYPNDASRYADPVQEVDDTDPLGEGTLDSTLPFIVLFGFVYFIFKFFRR